MFPSSFYYICSFYKRDFGDETKEAPGKISGPANCHLEDSVTEPSQIGDGFCDDDLNNEDNKYDGGDCCQTGVDCSYCINCDCHKSVSDILCKDFLLPAACTSDRSKLMISFGLDDEARSYPEVIDVENPNLKCDPLGGNLTIKYWQWKSVTAVGGLISGQPLICGPVEDTNCTVIFEENTNYTICNFYFCWQLDIDANWHLISKSLARFQAFGLPMTKGPNGHQILWVTGGETAFEQKMINFVPTSSTEYIAINGSMF